MKANAKYANESGKEEPGAQFASCGILRSQSGQSLVEVALLTPLLLALLIGGIELGRYAYIAILVGNAARAGAGYGAQSLVQSVDTTGIQTAADNDFQNNGQNVSNLTVTSSTSCGCDNGGTTTSAVCSTATNSSGGHMRCGALGGDGVGDCFRHV